MDKKNKIDANFVYELRDNSEKVVGANPNVETPIKGDNASLSDNTGEAHTIAGITSEFIGMMNNLVGSSKVNFGSSTMMANDVSWFKH
ncbi:hypothetical protein Tco_0140472 [Tanacetum coccineum]